MRILAVDDEKGYLSMLADMLGKYGFDVVLAEDGKQAREILDQEKVDLIISDIHMPTLDGVRFHSYVREFTDRADIPFILISGIDDQKSRQAIVDPKLDFFLRKSAPVQEMVSLIERLKRAGKAKSV
jgi:DNA-binding response OmpR family regulator